MILFPNDPLNTKAPDPQFEEEYEAAKYLNETVQLVDVDALWQGRPDDAVIRVKEVAYDSATYRGWMLNLEQYIMLHKALTAHNVKLITTPHQYANAHLMPKWYFYFRGLTPYTVFTTPGEEIKSLVTFGYRAVVIKDHVKSMKDYWDEAMFIPDASDKEAALSVIDKFKELRGSNLEGGVVLRDYEDFVEPEIRTWWVDGLFKLAHLHPNNPDNYEVHVESAVPFLRQLKQPVANVHNSLITVDIAKTVGGSWRVIEVGDGQVSDIHKSVNIVDFISMIV